MLLLIDAGNTRVKWAIADEAAPIGSWLASGALFHTELDLLAEPLKQYQPNRALLSNVAGEVMRARLETLLLEYLAPTPALTWFRSRAQQAGVVNSYRDPAQLGCDRFASLLGARSLFDQQPLLIVTAGTATTIDALDTSSHFLGGMILPGLATMTQSLALSAAQLPQVETQWAGAQFADNTSDAIVSGCIQAQVGAIMQARAQLPDAHCLLSGGAARYLLPCLPPPIELVEQLVLRGLHVAALSES